MSATIFFGIQVGSRVDYIYGSRIVTKVERNNPFDWSKSTHPSIFSSWSLEFDFTRLFENTTCWSISGEVSQERATKKHCPAGPKELCFIQLNLS